MEKIKAYLQAKTGKFKDNIQIIILLPTILGGLWQIFELSSISVSFIRFFSISQLVSDGLLILFILCLIYLALFVSPNPFKKIEKDEDLSLTNALTKIILSIGLFIWLDLPLIQEIYNNKSIDIFVVMLAIMLTTIFINLFIAGLSILYFKYLHSLIKVAEEPSKWNIFKEIIVKLIANGVVLIFVFTVILFLELVVKFRNTYVLPSNFTNIENVNCLLKNQYEINPSKTNIRYFNDKYLFIEYRNKQFEQQYLIIEFEALVNRENCNK